MGYSNYSNNAANVLRSSRASLSPAAVFTSSRLDKTLDPKGVKVRESRDSDKHPESNAVAVFFDETGSMGSIPQQFAMKELPDLMKLLYAKGYIAHPQVLFGAIGDASGLSEEAPLQVGQFESGLEMDDCLTKIYLEGNGGGQNHESYELALYFASKHFACDCWEKRNKKPYLFTIGDERIYDRVRKEQVAHYIGDVIEKDIPVKSLLEEINSKFEYFHIAINSQSYPHGHHKDWQELLGERALFLKDASGVCALIGMTIGACEGSDLDDAHADAVAAGMTTAAADAAKEALIPYTRTAGSLRKGTVTGDLEPIAGDSDGSKRI